MTIQKKKKVQIDKIVFIILALFPLFSHLILFWLSSQINGIKLAFTDATGALSLGNFEQVAMIFRNDASDLKIAFSNTMKYFVQGLCMIPIGLFAAYIVYKKVWGSKAIRVILMLPGMISAVMMAMLFQQFIMSNGPFVKFCTEVMHINLPLPLLVERGTATIMVYGIWFGLGGSLPLWFGAMNRIPNDIIEYASLDGVGPLREFTSIILPLIWPTFVTQVTFTLIGIFGSSGNVLLFTEGKYNTWTLSFWIYDAAYKGRENLYPIALALGLCMSIATVPIVIGGRWIMNKFGQEIQY